MTTDEHPMLANILSLAGPAAWQASLALAEQTISAWLETGKPGQIERIVLVGCGSSLYNGQVGKYFMEHLAHIPAEAVPAFAFARYAEPALLGAQTLVIGISTTGGTQAVCDALARARSAGSLTLAVSAYAGSPLTHSAQAALLTGGQNDKISVKTSSYVLALVTLLMLALRLAEARGEAGPEIRKYWLDQIVKAAEGAHELLTRQRGEIQALARQFAGASRAFILGSGPNLGTAEEASLKVIEMAKMPSECQDLENFMHGRLREVDQTNPLFFIAPHGQASDRTLDFLTVTRHIQAPTVVLSDEITPGLQELATHTLRMPGGLDEFATPLLYIIPLHLFGFELALLRGYDPNARRYNLVPQNVKYGDVL